MMAERGKETLMDEVLIGYNVIESQILKGSEPEIIKRVGEWQVLLIAAIPDGEGGAHIRAACNVEPPGDAQLWAAFGTMLAKRTGIPVYEDETTPKVV